MHHTELYLGVRFLIVGIALAFVFVYLAWEICELRTTD